jgi:2,3-bisphosphoglycerate-dependent phosphoglycerate mutase
MMHKVLYMVRHCQATGQEPEAELSPEGAAQAEALAHFLSESKIERIVSSPFLRALQSIEPFARSVGLTIETDERLIERILGDTSPSHWLACLRETFTNFDLSFPGGESSRAAQERAVSALQDILASEQQITVLISHGNLSTLLLNHFDKTIGFSTWEQMTNPDVFRVCLSASQATVEHIWLCCK